MPNHVTNVVRFDCKSKKFMEIADFIRGDASKELGHVDFNTLIPMPKELDVEAGSRGEKGYRAYAKYVGECKGLTEEQKSALKKIYLTQDGMDEETWELGKQYYENKKKYGAANWYEWCWDNWGTKWNAYDCQSVSEGDNELIFLTAWECVDKIIEALSKKFPRVRIYYQWADENFGFNVGEMSFLNGKCTYENIPEGGSSEAYEMAEDVLGYRYDEDEE